MFQRADPSGTVTADRKTAANPFPHLMNKDIYVTANLKHINSRKNKDDKEKEQILGIVPVRPMYPIS